MAKFLLPSALSSFAKSVGMRYASDGTATIASCQFKYSSPMTLAISAAKPFSWPRNPNPQIPGSPVEVLVDTHQPEDSFQAQVLTVPTSEVWVEQVDCSSSSK